MRAWILGAALLAGCTMMGHDANALRESYTELRADEASYHDRVIAAPTVVDVRSETDRYCPNMDALMDRMMAACGGMMGPGTVGEVVVRMRRSVGAYCSRMAGSSDLASMRAGCDEHHGEMTNMLDMMNGRM